MRLRAAPPAHEPGELTVLGQTSFRGVTKRIGLRPLDRLRHTYLVGKTGAGKSTLLKQLVVQDMVAGAGVAVFDPHGDLVDELIPLVPVGRRDDVVLYPGPSDRPVTWRLFDPAIPAAELVSSVISVMKREWRDSWGPRLEHVLRNGLLAVVPHPRASLVLLVRFLTQEDFRDRAMRFVKDPVVRAFWMVEWPSYAPSLRAEALSPILNKLGAITTHPTLRVLVAGHSGKLDLREHLGNNRILLANLSTASLGEDGTHLLGSLLLSSLLLAGARRPRGARPTFIYLDEAQYFVGESVATILSEARKYGLGLTLAHQYLGQLPPLVHASIIGNVGTKCLFRVGSTDASLLEPEVAPEYGARELGTLPAYHFVAKCLVSGLEVRPILVKSLPPMLEPRDAEIRRQLLRLRSAERFGQARARVEEGIRHALGVTTPSEQDRPL